MFHQIGKTTKRTYARKLQIKEISNIQARSFFIDNHLQGHLNSKLNYGLVDEAGILYSVMSFSKSRFSKELADWELTRFASIKGWSVVGAGQRLFKYFVRQNNPPSVVSYADLKWGHGEIYTKLGFTFKHYSNPNYWYFKTINEIHSRVKFQKHKLPSELHHLGSEWDIMQHLGWNRFWDCGNSVWVWTT